MFCVLRPMLRVSLYCLICYSNIYLSVGFAADPQLLQVFFVNIRATCDVKYSYDLYISLFYHLCHL
jgi:hypothetical protein